jgi:hypothetical protein
LNQQFARSFVKTQKEVKLELENVYKQYKSFGMVAIEETRYGWRNSKSPSWAVAAGDCVKEESGIKQQY